MMNPFKLEVYLSKYEFKAPYLLCCSDAESFSLKAILSRASEKEKGLWDNLQLGYTEDMGLPVLREAIAEELYKGLDKDNILCFSGAEEGIYCAMNVLCEKKDHVIVITPCYQSLKEIPNTLGCDVEEILLLEEEYWRINLERIKQSIKTNTKLIVINFPHNPTGQVINQSELESLVSICRENGIWLFSDEVYRLLGSPEEPWALPAASCYEKAMSLGVMSKAFGLAGLRIGWVACQDVEVLDKIKQFKHYTSICNSGLSEVVALISIKNKEYILERNNLIVSENLKLLDEFFEEYKEVFHWVRPQGGCIGFAKYKGKDSVKDFCQKLVNETGVLLLPDYVYDYDGNFFRIGFGRKNMPESLFKLKEFIDKEKG